MASARVHYGWPAAHGGHVGEAWKAAVCSVTCVPHMRQRRRHVPHVAGGWEWERVAPRGRWRRFVQRSAAMMDRRRARHARGRAGCLDGSGLVQRREARVQHVCMGVCHKAGGRCREKAARLVAINARLKAWLRRRKCARQGRGSGWFPARGDCSPGLLFLGVLAQARAHQRARARSQCKLEGAAPGLAI